MGDLNARTGNEDGLHEKLSKQLNYLLPDDIEGTNLETGSRCSCDARVNTPGRKLLTSHHNHNHRLGIALNLQMAGHLETSLEIFDVSTIWGQLLWTT